MSTSQVRCKKARGNNEPVTDEWGVSELQEKLYSLNEHLENLEPRNEEKSPMHQLTVAATSNGAISSVCVEGGGAVCNSR